MGLNRIKLIIYLALGALILGFIGFMIYQYEAPARDREKKETGERVTGRLPIVPWAPSTDEERVQQIQKLKPGEEISVSPEQKLIRITDFAVVSPSLNKSGDKILFYRKAGGDLFSSDFSGKSPEKISNITVIGMVEALWSPAKDRAAVFYLDGETLKGFLHIGTSSVAVLPQDIKSFSWSPDGKSLAYLLPKDTELNLAVADHSGKNPKTIFRTPVLDAQIQWITSDKIAFQTAPSGLADGFMFIFSRSAGTFTKIAGPLPGLTSLWSSDGSKTLISSTDSRGQNMKMGIYDSGGNVLMAETGVKTFPEKCAWSGTKTVYCAAPRVLPEKAVLPDDYLRGEFNTADTIVALDTEKKESKEIFADGNFDISGLLVAKNQDYLFFVNRTYGTLWALKLK